MWQKSVRFLDYNAGAGLHLKVQQQLIELLASPEFFAANPSSRHRLGQKMQHLLYRSARRVAKSFGANASPDHLLFTSSGTEANQTVIRSALDQGMTILIGAGEHSASYDLLKEASLLEVPLLPSGQYDLGSIYNLLIRSMLSGGKERKILISLFWANNETGVLTDLTELKKVIDGWVAQNPQDKIYLHLDGAQVWGKQILDLQSTYADWITFSAHKIGAPAGTGVIWSRSEKPAALIVGNQGGGLRGGTENWMGIFAAGVAAETVANDESVKAFQDASARIRDRFEQKLKATGMPITIWGESSPRIGNTSRFSLDSFKTYENWVELLDLKGFAVSHGSACRSQVIEPSRVLLKMGASNQSALNSIRVSFGPDSTAQDADDLVASLIELYHNKKQG